MAFAQLLLLLSFTSAMGQESEFFSTLYIYINMHALFVLIAIIYMPYNIDLYIYYIANI